MTKELIAQWVINNRYPKTENNKVSDHEMYYKIVDEIDSLVNKNESISLVSESKPFDIHNCINDIEEAVEAKFGLARWFTVRGSVRFQIKQAIDKMLYSR